mgnify:CR=1 FL=1
MAQEDKFGAHNYHPLPVVLQRAEGVHVWDVDGKQYYDFLSAYSAVNHVRCCVLHSSTCPGGSGVQLAYPRLMSGAWMCGQGHCHPRLVEVMQEQCKQLTLTSRAFFNDKLGPFSEYITNYFGFDRVRHRSTIQIRVCDCSCVGANRRV